MSIDQYKRGILKGSYTLSPAAKSSIANYAAQLKTYGAAFAAAKGLVANTDALKYFYSTFMPSTVVQNGKLIESITTAGLTGIEMWTCALESFNAENCGSTLLIGDENNLNELADISVNILKLPTENPTNPENMGVLVMLNGFGECMQKYFELEQVAFNMSRDVHFSNLTSTLHIFNNQAKDQTSINALADKTTLTTTEVNNLAVALGFTNIDNMNNFKCSVKSNVDLLQNYTGSYTSADRLTIITSADKYYGEGNSFTEEQAGNLGTTLSMGTCNEPEYISYRDITGDDVLYCGIKALGADALYALAFEGVTKGATIYTVKHITKTITKVGGRFLGFVGVAIAAVEFGLCINDIVHER